MAKHVGLIPSLDGGLYQVNGDKVEVPLIYALFFLLFIVKLYSISPLIF